MIQSNVNNLISSLYKLQNDYILLDNDNRKKFYYEKREQFNHLDLNNSEVAKLEKAALFIFLNKTCFNGLYRVNKQGYFNVPQGKYKNPKICDTENLQNISKSIKDLNIICADYQETLNFIDANTFVYVDPPYRPVSNTSNFTAYTNTGFDDSKQIKLSTFVHKVNEKGAKVVISNSDTQDNFFNTLYKDYSIYRIEATRRINSNIKYRGKVSELIISNFQKDNISPYAKWK